MKPSGVYIMSMDKEERKDFKYVNFYHCFYNGH